MVRKKNRTRAHDRVLTPDIISMMIRKKENWDACAGFVEKVLRQKKADEHLVDYTRLRGARQLQLT